MPLGDGHEPLASLAEQVKLLCTTPSNRLPGLQLTHPVRNKASRTTLLDSDSGEMTLLTVTLHFQFQTFQTSLFPPS